METMHDALPRKNQRKQISSSLPKGKPFADLKASDPKHAKASGMYKWSLDMGFNSDCYPNVELQVPWVCSEGTEEGEKLISTGSE